MPEASAAALRGLHVAGDPLILANAWDAGTARLVEQASFAAVATTSSGVAEALCYEDGEQTPVAEMLAAVARVARAVELPVTADMEAGYGLDDAELAQRVLAAGAVGLNLEDSDHGNEPALVPVERHAARIARIKQSADLMLNARVDVHLRGGATAEALERDAPIATRERTASIRSASPRRTRLPHSWSSACRSTSCSDRARRRSSGWPGWASRASASATSCTRR